MATFRNRHGKWQARVQRKGQQPVSKSFQSKEDAQRWARQIEAEIDKGSYTNIALAERTLFKDVIERYIQEVTLKTRSMREDTYRLKALARHPVAKLRMTALTPIKVAEYRDERLKLVSNGAVIRELSYFSSIINHARREWGINMINPLPLVKKPASPQGRNRILTEEELGRLYAALTPRVKNANHWILPLTKFALETAMRRGEILGLRWEDIDLQKRTAFIPLTKNGMSRLVPLSTAALEILLALPRNLDGRVFPVTPFTLSAAIDRARIKAKLEDFHFHDLRRMAITRLAEKLPNLIELSAVSGHKSLAMLKRYYHPDPEKLAKKLG
ncbi:MULTISPECIES: site-specific integrase [unclassified Polynucleobacter]|uniref:site-specific integrase n=1 Tax=unclassified Polynucleobacter TaxID=2640945 RepID=UPI0025743893|nr:MULTISPECIES: site-specific integrase [unclassified Polynucleobacter]BEI43321.1 site-specific integrase [Polynucleobacter sp. HIN10]BEI45097.1 site-specific integrase [Polynucleobacter sp. HIN11]